MFNSRGGGPLGPRSELHQAAPGRSIGVPKVACPRMAKRERQKGAGAVMAELHRSGPQDHKGCTSRRPRGRPDVARWIQHKRHLRINPADWKYFTVFEQIEEFEVGHDLDGITDECFFHLGQLPQSMKRVKLEMSEATGEGGWRISGFDDQRMLKTFSGAADKRIAMAEYLLNDEDADVPVSVGVAWRKQVHIARFPMQFGHVVLSTWIQPGLVLPQIRLARGEQIQSLGIERRLLCGPGYARVAPAKPNREGETCCPGGGICSSTAGLVFSWRKPP